MGVVSVISRRYTTRAAAVVLAAAAITAATAGSADAAAPYLTSGKKICLTNSSNVCLSISGSTIFTDISSNSPTWTVSSQGTYYLPYSPIGSYNSYYIKAGNGKCIGLSSDLTTAVLASCGSNGTVWIWATFQDGQYLVSRYFLDHHDGEQVLGQGGTGYGWTIYVVPTTAGYWVQWSNV